MTITLNNLKSSKGSSYKKKRLGRGNASGKGTTAGRGTKGQLSRSGGRNRHKLRGLRRLVLATPKLRGFKRQGAEIATVNLKEIQSSFEDGAVIRIHNLKSKGLISSNAKFVKVLGFGTLKKAVKIQGCNVSVTAKEKILASGGEVR